MQPWHSQMKTKISANTSPKKKYGRNLNGVYTFLVLGVFDQPLCLKAPLLRARCSALPVPRPCTRAVLYAREPP
jgi:hypothetical protein